MKTYNDEKHDIRWIKEHAEEAADECFTSDQNPYKKGSPEYFAWLHAYYARISFIQMGSAS